MKKTALTILLAGALFSAGCSESTEKTTAATATPVPELTAEQKAAIKNSEEANKAAELRKKSEPAQSDAVAEPAAINPATALETSDTGVKPTPTP